jgi:hypothetical protein
MPIEQQLWRISEGKPERVSFSPMASESRLEQALVADFSILDPELLVVGRQVPTAFGKFIDILAIDREGVITIVELKRDRTPREIVAQIIDYASWVKDLTYEEIAEIFSGFRNGERLEQVFERQFGGPPPTELNEEHRLLIVASELDPSTERIVRYLSDGYGVPLNVAFFRYFNDNGSEYLSRTWLIEPNEAEAKASKAASAKSGREPWNGRDYYVSFGDDQRRNWEDARKYGFISAGGGLWFSNTLQALTPGARVFVCVPKRGYVGVGIVKAERVPVKDFMVEVDGIPTPILVAPLKSEHLGDGADDPDRSDYAVRVQWIKTLPLSEAIWEKGMFANQNSACRLRNKFTLDILTQRFGVEP